MNIWFFFLIIIYESFENKFDLIKVDRLLDHNWIDLYFINYSLIFNLCQQTCHHGITTPMENVGIPIGMK